jgi:prepilin peptidase dependent protein B
MLTDDEGPASTAARPGIAGCGRPANRIDAHHPKRETGFTLIELMTAGAVGLLLLSAVIWLFAGIVRSSRSLLEAAHLEQMMAATMAVMTGELRRAGYWSGAWKMFDEAIDNGFAPLHVVDGSCVLYSYDRDKDDTDGIPDEDDQHGLRLRNGAIQIKTSDGGCGMTTCDSCTSGNWSALTDPSTVRIERLSFQISENDRPFNAGRNLARVREVVIELTGSLRRDPAMARTLRGSVNVRNDEIL